MKEALLDSIKITKEATEHFVSLLSQEEEGTNLRVFVAEAYTPNARVGVTYCPKDCSKDDDIPKPLGDFILYVEGPSLEALKDAEIDYETSEFGGQLSIKAPNIKGKKPAPDGPLLDRVKYFIDSEVNPQLASHGGFVAVVEITNEGSLVLQFGGGCQGCSMVDATLKYGIEEKIKEYFPEIQEIVDVTEHATGENPYYK